MKRVVLLLCMLALCTAAAGCAQETALQLPFDAAQVTGVEMYRFTVPADAEKKVLTQEADIRVVYELFDGLAVSDRKTRAEAGETVTGFRFYLTDGAEYELISCAQGVKRGRLVIPGAQAEYFTSADVGAAWQHGGEAAPAKESELPAIS